MKKVGKIPKGEKKVEKGKIEQEIYMALIGLHKKERLNIIKISKHKCFFQFCHTAEFGCVCFLVEFLCLLTSLWDVINILNMHQNCSKDKLVFANAVTGIMGT